MFKKRFLGIVASLALTIPSSAYDAYKNNIDITFGGGLQSNQINPDEGGKNSPRFGWLFNANYRHMFNEHWGLGTGLGLGYYKSKAKYKNLLISNDLVHPHNGQPYENKAQFNDWVEAQRLMDLEIPLAVYYMTPVNDKWNFIADLGGKVMIPIWNRYHTNEGELEIRGFFEEYTNIEYHDLPIHGFTKYQNFYGESDIKPVTGAAFADAGMMYKLKKNRSLYLGVYFSYSFLNLSEKHEEKLFNGKDYTGVVSSNLVDKTYLMSTGIKVGLSFGYPKIKEDTIAVEEPTAVYPYCDPELQPEQITKEPSEVDLEAERLAKLQKMREDSLRMELEKTRLEKERLEKEIAQMEKVKTSIKWLNTHLKVNFDKNKAVVEPNKDNDEHIRVLSEYISDNPDKIIIVTGHTCNLGKEDYNVKLGMRRAEAMKEVMMEAGIPEKNIKLDSKGSKEPVAPNDNEVNRRKNRRVVLSIE